jgi:hypothetical protein
MEEWPRDPPPPSNSSLVAESDLGGGEEAPEEETVAEPAEVWMVQGGSRGAVAALGGGLVPTEATQNQG